MTNTTIERFRPRGDSFFGLGQNTEGITDLREFIAARGMDYEVRKEQVFVPASDSGDGIVTPVKYEAVQNQYVVRRESDGAIVSPQTLSKQYGEIGPLDMVGDLEPFVLEGFAVPDAAFKIAKGGVECVEAISLRVNLPDTDDPFQSKLGEAYRAYIVARNYHGRGSASASLFLERMVCSNGMTALCRQSGFAIAHRGNVRDKVSVAMNRWKELRILMLELAERLGGYMDITMSYGEAEKFVDNLLDIKQGEKLSTQKTNLRMALLDAYNMPRFGTHGRTVADMYHGVTWVGSHYTAAKSKLDADDIAISLLEGTRGNREHKAIALLDKFVASK